MPGEGVSVTAYAADEVGAAPVLVRQPEDIEAGDGGRAAALLDRAVLVDDAWNGKPRVGAAVARRPDDRRDIAQVDRARPSRHEQVLNRLALVDGRVLVDAARKLSQARVGRGEVVAEVVAEDCATVVEALKSTGNCNSRASEPVEAEVLTAVRAAQWKEGHTLCRLEIRQIVDRPVEVAEDVEPREGVASAQATGRA